MGSGLWDKAFNRKGRKDYAKDAKKAAVLSNAEEKFRVAFLLSKLRTPCRAALGWTDEGVCPYTVPGGSVLMAGGRVK